MHEIKEGEGNIVIVTVSGALTKEDYDELIPSWNAAIARHGKLRLLFIMRDFHGWEPIAAWEDVRFTREHSDQIERVAMVGEKRWQEWMSQIGSLFVSGEVKYFEIAQLNEAKHWLASAR